MKTFDGYKKRALTDSNLLLASGGDKPLSDFIGTLNWDSTNRKLQYKKIGDASWNDLVLFGSNATDNTAYFPDLSTYRWTSEFNSPTGWVRIAQTKRWDASGIFFIKNDNAGGVAIFLVSTNWGCNPNISLLAYSKYSNQGYWTHTKARIVYTTSQNAVANSAAIEIYCGNYHNTKTHVLFIGQGFESITPIAGSIPEGYSNTELAFDVNKFISGGFRINGLTNPENYLLSADGSYVAKSTYNLNTAHTTFAWTGGTAAGPTGSLSGNHDAVSFPAIPSASSSASGIVTTGSLTFAGVKTIDGSASTSLYVKGTTATYIGFKNSDNATIGYLGIKGSDPIYYNTSDHVLWHDGNFTPSDYITKKDRNGFFPFIGSAVGYQWYKITLPYNKANYSAGASTWEMISFDINFGGPYTTGGASGVCHLNYYMLYNGSTKVYTAANVRGVVIGPSTSNEEFKILYDIENPLILYVQAGGGNLYRGIAITNLFCHDTARARDFRNTTIEGIQASAATGATAVPLTYVSHDTYSGKAADSTKLDGNSEISYFRSRGYAAADNLNTLWSTPGVKQFGLANGTALTPDGLTTRDKYYWGSVISIPGESTRFDLWYNCYSTGTGGVLKDGLYYRVGWGATKGNWFEILDQNNYTSYINSSNFPILAKSASDFVNIKTKATSGFTLSLKGWYRIARTVNPDTYGTLNCFADIELWEAGTATPQRVKFRVAGNISYCYIQCIECTPYHTNRWTKARIVYNSTWTSKQTAYLEVYAGDSLRDMSTNYVNVIGGLRWEPMTLTATAADYTTVGESLNADKTIDIKAGYISANFKGPLEGNADTATSAGKLTTARKTYVTLGTASTSTTRDWSGDTTIPVDGTLGVANGGTGVTSIAALKTALGFDIDSIQGYSVAPRNLVLATPTKGGRSEVYNTYSIKLSPKTLGTADTYFHIVAATNIEPGKYVLSYDCSGFVGDDYIDFAFLNVASRGLIRSKNGHCLGVITVTSLISKGSNILIDDSGNSGGNSDNIIISNFSLRRCAQSDFTYSNEELINKYNTTIFGLSFDSDNSIKGVILSNTRTEATRRGLWVHGLGASDTPAYGTGLYLPYDAGLDQGAFSITTSHGTPYRFSIGVKSSGLAYSSDPYATDYTQLFHIGSNGHVSIGTTPQANYAFYVNGNGKFSSTLDVYTLNITNEGGSNEITFARGNFNYLRAKTSGGKIAFITNGKDMSGSSVDMYVAQGLVVINRGTTASNYTLDVNGSLLLNGDLVIKDGAGIVIPNANASLLAHLNGTTYVGMNDTLKLRGSGNLIHVKGGTDYTIYDSSNFTPGDYLPLAGGKMTGDAPIEFEPNKIALNFRNTTSGNLTLLSKVEFMTSGNEALVFANSYTDTSFMFFNNVNITDSNNWYSLGNPAVQIKKQSLYINELIGNGVAPTYNLKVAGTGCFTNTLTLSGSPAISFVTNSYAGYIKGCNADGKIRWDMYSEKNDGTIGNLFFRVATNADGTTFDIYKFTRDKAIYMPSITDNWNVAAYTESKIRILGYNSAAATGAPGQFYSGFSVVSNYVGFLLATYGGNTEDLRFRKLLDNSTWHNWHVLYHDGNKPTKSDVGLGNVENTALSTWAGSSNLTTCSLGTFGSIVIKGAGDYLSNTTVISGRNLLKPTITAGANSEANGVYSIKLPCKTNADTYFYVDLYEALTYGETYTLSFEVSGVKSGTVWYFPFFQLGAGSSYTLIISGNGRFLKTFKVEHTGTAYTATHVILDDSTRNWGAELTNNPIIISNISLVKGNVSADFTYALEEILTKQNYNSYSPKLDGTGATGNWGISVTGTAAGITGYSFKNLTAAGTSGWTTYNTDSKIIPTMAFMAYWNGAYSGTSSNLTYCAQGSIIGSNNIGSLSVASATTSTRARLLETKYLDGSNWYGANYPVYALWDNSTNVRLKCDGYTTWVNKADYATSATDDTKVPKKWSNRFYPYVGSSAGSIWYKVTLPASGNTYGGTLWHMISMEIHVGGPCSSGCSGIILLSYYFSQAASGGAYTVGSVSGKVFGDNMTSTVIRYTTANPMVFYIKASVNQYNAISIQNLTVSDNGSAYDFTNTKIETSSDPGTTGMANVTLTSVIYDGTHLALGGGTMTGAILFASGDTTSTLPGHYFHRLYSTNHVYTHFYPSGTGATNTSWHFRTRNASGNTYKEGTYDYNGSMTIPGSYYANSDIRYKNVHNLLNVDLHKLADLPLFSYNWKNDNLTHVGSSALAVEIIIPELITENETGFKSLDYATLGTIAGVTACKELVKHEDELTKLKQRVIELEELINQLKNR